MVLFRLLLMLHRRDEGSELGSEECNGYDISLYVRSSIVRTENVPFGVLDVHFSHHNTILGCATSTGSLAFYKLKRSSDHSPTLNLQQLRVLQLFDIATIVTALSWSPTLDSKICVSLTTGEVMSVTWPTFYQSAFEEDLVACVEEDLAVQTLHRHDLEAWTVVETSTSWMPHGVFCGGDDAVLSFTANQVTEEGGQSSSNRRIHGAGVVAILPLPSPPFPAGVVLTGSYDDHLRILSIPTDTPMGPLRAKVLHEINLGGGVWRIKIMSLKENITNSSGNRVSTATLLISCMYAGAFIVELTYAPDTEEWRLEVVGEFKEHDSMCYACDFRSTNGVRLPQQGLVDGDDGGERGSSSIAKHIVSCSFYDKRLCLWKWS